ncbi:DUF748 domain-containing protein [Marinobacterium sedimentorum]|uniref:DUF748 domain-containing protein n=1 Tax=Marinobacterium sedimentorum TaxID=2927804 RepID=UPI0020C5CDA8|nr:DUF748 domain-containing protein [Marinobacterium sedimentorum]MCP8688972.1 DUF748 domain-containing protein [Marinobacterium sedimentorum]
MKGIKWASGVLVGFLLCLHTLPYVLRDQAVIWLQAQGAEDVGLRALKLNWRQGRIEVDALHAQAPGRLPLNVGQLVLDIDIPRLFEQQLLVSELTLADIESGVRLRDGELWLGPVNLSALHNDQAPEDSAQEKGEASSWRVGVDRIRIDRLNWRTELPDQQHDLALAVGELGELYQWRENEQSRLRLDGRLNGAPFHIDTQTVPLPTAKTSDMTLSLAGFPLESVTAPFVPGLSAKLSFDLTLSAALAGNDGLLKPAGRLSLENLNYNSDDLSLMNQQISWEGDLSIELKSLLPSRITMKAFIELMQPRLQQRSGFEAALTSLSWKGDLGLELDSSAQPSRLDMNAVIEALKPAARDAAGLDAGLESLSWSGDLGLKFDSGAQPDRLDMNAAIEALKPVAHDAAGLDAGLESLNWNGALGLVFASGAPASLLLDGDLKLAGNRAQLPGTLNASLAGLDWKGRVDLALAQGTPANLTAKGALGLGETRLQLPDTGDIGLQKGRWNGSLQLGFASGQPQDVTLAGDLLLDNYQLKLLNQSMDASLGTLGWSGNVKARLPDAVRQLEVDGTLSATQGAVNSPQFSASLNELNWQGATRLVQQSLKVDGEIDASVLAFKQPQRLNAQLDSMTGRVQLSSADLAAFAVKVPALSARRVNVTAGQQGYPLATLDALELEAMSLQESMDLDLKVLRLSRLNLARAGDMPLAAVGQVQMSGLTYRNGRQAVLSRLSVNDSSIRFRLNKDGQSADIAALQVALDGMSGTATASGGVKTGAASSGSTGGDAVAWKLDRLELGGRNHLLFEDASSDPAFMADVDIKRFQVRELGSLNKAPSPFELKATINQFAQLDANGAINLIGGVSDGQWQATLSDVELPALSPYSIRYTGYYLNSGQLHLNTEGTLTDRKIDGTNNVRLNRVAVDRVDADQSAELSQQLAMPLETALALLQDDNQNIELEVPISGSLDSPDFGYQSVINIIAEKGLKSAAMGFLTSALQPYGALITLAGMAADASKSGSAIELAPVEFAPGITELDPGNHDYLNKITDMLNAREGLRLNLCGQAVLQDRAMLQSVLVEEQSAREAPLDEAGLAVELKKRLQSLADRRAAAVKSYLGSRVQGDRLFLCYSKLELAEAEARPVVFLGL